MKGWITEMREGEIRLGTQGKQIAQHSSCNKQTGMTAYAENNMFWHLSSRLFFLSEHIKSQLYLKLELWVLNREKKGGK